MNERVFDQLIGRCRAVAATLPDRRTGDNSRYAMADIASAAFAEFITPQDGAVKQDCEINAAKRWLAAYTARYATRQRHVAGR
jgi:hypothetical protein